MDDHPITVEDFASSISQTQRGAYLQVISGEGVAMIYLPIDLIKTVFQRGLNTWADAPEGLFEFSNDLEKL
jgi:hypothetical protein